MRINNTLLKPRITEKSMKAAGEDKYTFTVRLNSSKEEISKEIRALFGVDVVAVNTLILPGKPKRVMGTRKFIKTSKTKKAIVQIKKGQKIDLFPKE